MQEIQYLQEDEQMALATGSIPGIDSEVEKTKLPDNFSLVKHPFLTREQVAALRAPTPRAVTLPSGKVVKIVKELKKGGKTFSYVPVYFYERKMDRVFGTLGYSFFICSKDLIEDNAVVEGKLVVHLENGQERVLMQFGGQQVAREILCFKKDGKEISTSSFYKLKNEEQNGWQKVYGKPLDLGDALKGAASDAFKKCCSKLGMFSDIYSPEEFIPMEEEKKAPAGKKSPPLPSNAATTEQRDEINALAAKLNITFANVSKRFKAKYGVSITQMTKGQAVGVIDALKSQLKK